MIKTGQELKSGNRCNFQKRDMFENENKNHQTNSHTLKLA